MLFCVWFKAVFEVGYIYGCLLSALTPPKRKSVSYDFEASSSTSGQVSYQASMLRSSARHRMPAIDRLDSRADIVSNELLESSEYLDLGSCTEGGKVVIDFPLPTPELLRDFMRRSHFRLNIRAYDSMFSMTSFSVNVDES
ncbi:hypothetical protein QVD17_38132 [Tagetes erecta]|uniref:Uncharacterized protein n=1 Tax=Tagetes erecta TaxID=13708 RepID=A0AAD8K1U3_TARER|nr:hypothetical protein QVD17_38132 [Tagetes erecta]